MQDNMVSAISAMVLTGLSCIWAVTALIKPQWIIGRSTWYRVRKEKEEAYKKKFARGLFLDAAFFFIGGILAYLGVHEVIILLMLIPVLIIELIVRKLMPKKESYFYDNSDR